MVSLFPIISQVKLFPFSPKHIRFILYALAIISSDGTILSSGGLFDQQFAFELMLA